MTTIGADAGGGAGGRDGGTWFVEVADFLGPAYLRYSFTKGTEQEVDFLVGALGLEAGVHRILDVGCGPGRHAHAFARRGFEVHGVDISDTFVDLARAGAPPGATFAVADARHLAFDADFDIAISLCQGGFGLVGDDDGDVLAGMARAVEPGTGRVAFSAFSAYFMLRYLEDHDSFDADRGVNTETTELRNDAGETRSAELHTSCFTPRELRLLCRAAGLAPEAVWSVTPGAYAMAPPTTDSPEFLVVGVRLSVASADPPPATDPSKAQTTSP
ncbi:MAG TPA: class I SAM-dependent methyltransferase [Acidimicrobiales bacterium]|nr:class I SAM-dependent methyltransferase [Acidimicrobiales bacterium]